MKKTLILFFLVFTSTIMACYAISKKTIQEKALPISNAIRLNIGKTPILSIAEHSILVEPSFHQKLKANKTKKLEKSTNSNKKRKITLIKKAKIDTIKASIIESVVVQTCKNTISKLYTGPGSTKNPESFGKTKIDYNWITYYKKFKEALVPTSGIYALGLAY